MSRMWKWAHISALTGVLAVLAALAGPAGAAESLCEQGKECPQLTAVYAKGYLVYYKKPGWSKWKCCGPYSYNKACEVADDLQAQGCITKVKQAP